MELTVDNLDAVLADMRKHRGDTTDVEVKRAAGGLPQGIGTTISAFANMPGGGLIVLGVNEAEGFSINGVTDPAGIEAAVVSVARNSVAPPPYIETAAIDYEGLSVILAQVEGLPPREKPARYRGKAYLRQADGDYEMSAADLHMLEVAKLNDAERINGDTRKVPGTTIQDLDTELVSAFLRQVRSQSSRLRDLDDQTVLRQLGVITPDESLTVAGIYALGNFPQGLLPALQVTAAVQLPRDGGSARTQNLKHFDGPLPVLLDELMDWATANLTTRQEYQHNGHLRNTLELPPRAVREALANALVHRDLSPDTLGLGKSVQVRINNRVLTITNPGGLRGLTLSQITSNSPAQAAVNQRLYGIAKYLRTRDGENVIEGEGGGVKEILRATVESDLHRPQLIDTGVQFTANLWRGAAFSPDDAAWLKKSSGGHELTHLQKQVLLKAREGEQWEINALRQEFSPLSSIEAEDQLRDLVRWGLIEPSFEQDESLTSISNRTTADSYLSKVREPDFGAAPEHSARLRKKMPTVVPSVEVRKMSKNAPHVLVAIQQGNATIPQIAEASGLNHNQVRYALKNLESHGRVIMKGGQGRRDTQYVVV